MEKIKLKKMNQEYLNKILLEYPSIRSGRKNYSYQYKRILKNILLAKLYLKKFIPKKNNIIFIENKMFCTIKIIKK